MKIVFNKQKMANTVAPLMCCVSGKSTLTAVEGILMEAKLPDTLILTTFDLEKGMRITTNVEVIEEGSFIINAQKFNQTLKVMDSDTLTLTVNDKCHAIIEYGKSVHQMNALHGSDFPTIPNLESVNNFVIGQGVIKELINKVSFAMGVNDQRNVLNGCYFEVEEGKMLAVACDSFRLAKCEKLVDIENTGTGTVRHLAYAFIIPNKSIGELQRILQDGDDKKVKVFVTHRNIIFNLGDMIFFTRVVDGYYIDYEKVIVKNHKIFVDVDREELLSALERACLITEERIVGMVRANVKLDVSGGLLKILANSSAGSTYDEIEVNHEGEDIFIAFNNKYLIDCIRACGGDSVKISLSSAHASINVVPIEKDETINEEYMLLPVRLNN
ncbi:MAG: DNA polymerase III subunit beta [Clostridia bacterium]|nr:DNA polymerase III subunit beta [Clostridia bacterium]